MPTKQPLEIISLDTVAGFGGRNSTIWKYLIILSIYNVHHELLVSHLEFYITSPNHANSERIYLIIMSDSTMK